MAINVISPQENEENVFPWSQLFIILIVNLLTFGTGLQFGWPSPTIPILISEESPVPMSIEEASYLTVIPAITAIISSPLFAHFTDTIGRKKILLFLAVPQIVSWFMIAFSKSLIVFYIARALNGITDGGVFITIPIYIGEILEPKIRGRFGSLLSFTIYFGQFLVNCVGAYVPIQTSALIFSLPSAIFLLVFIHLPETPYYFLMKNDKEEARKSLLKLRTTRNVEEELEKLTTDVRRQTSEPNSMKHLFAIASNRKALLIATGLRTAHHLSGIAAFSVYNQYLFAKAGGDVSERISAIIFSGIQAFAVCFGPLIIDKFGRRPLILCSSFGCAVILSAESLYFYFSEYNHLNISNFNWFPIVGMIFYIIAFCSGFGIIPTLMLSELFTANMKGKALCCMSVYYAFGVSITSKMFQLMVVNWGMLVPFLFFAVCCYVSTLFCYYYVPETKGKTLEEIQQYLKK